MYMLFWCSHVPIFGFVHVAGYSQDVVTVISNSRITSCSVVTMAGKGLLKPNYSRNLQVVRLKGKDGQLF